MDKKTITHIATAALITTAGITVTNNVKTLNNVTGSGEVKAATAQSAQQFVNKAASAATNASSKYGTYTSVMIAQAAVESGYGNSTLSQEPNNNLFGIKGDYNGQSVTMKTGEYGSNGYYTINADFRKYPSYEESFNDNGSLLRSQMGDYYSGTWVENSNSGKEATQNGLQGKYATAPNYSQTLNDVIDTYNLDQYDPETTEVNESKTVTNTTPIVDAPVDSDVGNQVGTAREGQQVNVTKYITYKNGVSHAYIGNGWVNNSAFAITQPTTTDTSTNQITQPTKAEQTITNQTQTAKPKSTQTVKPATPTPVKVTKAVKAATTKTTKSDKLTQAAKPVEAVVKTSKPKTITTKNTKSVAKAVTAAKPVQKLVKASTTPTPVATQQAKKTVAKTVAAVKPVQKLVKASTTVTPVTTQQAKKISTTKNVVTSKPVVTTQTKSDIKTTSSSKAATIKKTDAVKTVVKDVEVAMPVVDDIKADNTKKTNDVITVAKSVKSETEKQAPVRQTKTSVKSDIKATTKTTTVAVAPKAAIDAVVETTEEIITPVKKIKSTNVVSKVSKSVTTSATQKVATKKVKSSQAVTIKTVQPATGKKTTTKNKLAIALNVKANSKIEKLATKPIIETTTTKKVSAEASQIKNNDYVIKVTGVLTINSRPDYGVSIWTIPGKKRTNRYLKNGTSWKFFKLAVINGEKWYNLGGNQWVPAKAVMVR